MSVDRKRTDVITNVIRIHATRMQTPLFEDTVAWIVRDIIAADPATAHLAALQAELDTDVEVLGRYRSTIAALQSKCARYKACLQDLDIPELGWVATKARQALAAQPVEDDRDQTIRDLTDLVTRLRMVNEDAKALAKAPCGHCQKNAVPVTAETRP